MNGREISKFARLVACLALFAGACGQVEALDEQYMDVGRKGASLNDVDIEIQQPVDGSFVQTNVVTVKGLVSGMSHNMADVYVNGVHADVLHEGSDFFKWSAKVPVSVPDIFNPLVAEVVVSGVDTGKRDLIHVIAGDSIGQELFAEESVALRINDSGLDKIEPEVAAGFDFDIADYLKVGELELLDTERYPLAVQELVEQSLDAYLIEASSAGVRIDLDARDGYFAGTATMSNLFIRLALVLLDDLLDTNEIDFAGLGCVIDMSVDEVRFEGHYLLDPPPYDPTSGAQKFVVVRDDGAIVELDDFVWDFTMGVCDLPNAEVVTDAVLQLMFGDIESLLASRVKAALTGVNTAATLEAQLDQMRFDKLGPAMGVTLEAITALADEDSEGLVFGTATRINADPASEHCQPLTNANNMSPGVQLRAPSELPKFDESLAVSMGFPGLTTMSAPNGAPFDLAVALSPSTLNQFLKASAECGFPEVTIGGLNLGFGVPLAMTITPTLAPVVTGQLGPAGEDLDLRIGGYRFVMYDPADGTFYANGSVGAQLGVALSVQGGSINALINSPTAQAINVELGETALPMDEVPWETVLPAIIAPLISPLQSTFQNISFVNQEDIATQLLDVAPVNGFITVFAALATGTCPAGQGLDAGLCYPRCEEGYEGFQGECAEECPAGFIDKVSSCYHDFESNPKHQMSRGVGTWPICESSEEKVGARCYRRCYTGYRSEGLYCRKPCPSGYVDDGVTCRKPEVIVSQRRYYRGSGSSLTCASNEQKQNGICYPKCKSGYYGSGIYCYQSGCPSGYTNNGASCHRPMRSVWTCGTCPSGYRDDGCICTRSARTYWKKKYYRGSGRGVHTCKSGYEKDGLLCYPKCSSGYDGVASYCWKYCPSGYVDDGATCRKPTVIISQQSYGRGTGAIPDSCPSGRYLEDGLCYIRCIAGYTGVGAICYKDCPDGYTDDGLFCRMDEVWYPKDVYEREGTVPVTN
jgi:hypothetical protein